MPVLIAHIDPADSFGTMSIENLRTQHDPQAATRRLILERCRDFPPRASTITGTSTCASMRSKAVFQPSSHVVKTACGARSWRHPEAIAHRFTYARGEHDTGSIVATEDNRPFQRTRGEHRPARDDLPKSLPDLVRSGYRQMVRHALERSVRVAVVSRP